MRLSLVLFLLLTMLGVNTLFSQCIPDTTFSELYYSEFGNELPPARVNHAYEAVINIRVPQDTTLLSQTISIDSGIISALEGLPTGLEYECDRARCAYPGGTYGCIRIYGTPTDSSEVGTRDLTMTLEIYSSIFSGPQDIDEFSIELLNDYPASVSQPDIEELLIVPSSNPMSNASSLRLTFPSSAVYELKVFSLTGMIIAQFNSDAHVFEDIQIPIEQFNLMSGVYFATVSQGDKTTSIRFVIR
jgi:hypothetical protein